jgi:hypothetical protein
MLHATTATSIVVRPRASRAGIVVVLVAAIAVSGAFQGCSGGSGNTSDLTAYVALLKWNKLSLDAAATDAASGAPEQLGPGRTARALAIVHIAMFEALIAADGGYQSYVGIPPGPSSMSRSTAVAQAAHDTLASLFPAQLMTFDDALAADLALVEDGAKETNGIAVGQTAASAILGMRFGDGSQIPEPVVGVGFMTNPNPGFWRPDPVSMIPIALGAFWGQVVPFALTTADQFMAPPPPGLTDTAYTIAYDEVKTVGGDTITTPSIRTPDQTVAGIYWAYDGSPDIGTPPVLYNQIACVIGTQQGLGDLEFARLLALVNVAMADAGIACWQSKYAYQFWRPVTAIRESDPGTGPTMLGDGNAATIGDLTYTPLGAPASNQMSGVNFTPPFPAYPSGHATFGCAVFQVLRRFFATDNIAFTFVSDEFDGVATDNMGNPRPLLPRSFQNLTQAEDENGQSRIYLGIHWSFDRTAGITQGHQVGDWVFDHVYQPVP